MKIAFTFENPLPNRLADAEVFVQTAKALAERNAGACLIVPAARSEAHAEGALLVRGRRAPLRNPFLRHLYMAASLPFRAELRASDLVYTRNLLVATVAIACGRRVVFDHYRPWGDQLPFLQPFLRALFRHPRFLLAICHSQLTRRCYERIGVEPHKLEVIHTGFDPDALLPLADAAQAKRGLGLDPARPIAVYAGRVNHKKGLEVLLAVAALVPELDLLLVGAEGGSVIDAQARALPNVKLVPFQPRRKLARYLHAADALLIPPSSAPLGFHGSTVLPLKTFLYLGAGKPIVAGATVDNREVLVHGENAWLVPPDRPAELAAALRRLLRDPELAARLRAGARETARHHTWAERAQRIERAIAERGEPRAPSPTSHTLRESLQWFLHLVRTGHWALPCRELWPSELPPIAPAQAER